MEILDSVSDIELSGEDEDLEESDISESLHSLPSKQNIIRVGADRVGPSTIEIPEVHWDDKDDLPLAFFAGPGTSKEHEFSKIVTPKDMIKWSKRDFTPPNIVWDEKKQFR